MFQIALDDSVDDVTDWLEEQPIVTSVLGESPLDAALKEHNSKS